MRVEIKLSKKWVSAALILIVTIGATASILYVKAAPKNPLPSNIKTQLAYQAIYPSKTSQIDSTSYNYQVDRKTLSFNVKAYNNQIVFTEEPAPDNLGSDGQIYYPAIGIHPYAQFQTKLGPVALAKFWQSSSLTPIGQSGILASQGTLLIAHSDNNLTNAEWKTLFDSLKITR
ncbi:MAG TPA: hypothetical protein VH234_04235 [Candidatus Saccharimonadales bacterium]|jgi:hypothetical protein|nr:hypothetical protein [Candidatus Saccharimonadales bacterium]